MKILIFIQLLIVYTLQNIGSSKQTSQEKTSDTYLFNKPEMPVTWMSRFIEPFDPVWMDYCDPHHCRYFNKYACGLNRKQMRFKMFVSKCHLIMNNKCSVFRGFLKYDIIDVKYCQYYKILLRGGCPDIEECADYEPNPVCTMNIRDGHIVLFQNQCYMDVVNCRNSTLDEYEKIYTSFCETGLNVTLKRDSTEENDSNLQDDYTNL